MSKRAGIAALKALPPRWRKTKDGKGKIDSVLPVRKAYIRAYEQAENATIERAIAWLKEHANDYIVDLTPTYPDAPVNIIVGGRCWDDLKEYLEEE